MSIDEKALSNACKWAEHRGLDWSMAREVIMAYEAAKTVQPVEATKPSSDYKATRGILAPYLPEEPNPTSDKDTTHD